MALIKCKDCQKDISDSAESCPNCGAPVPKVVGINDEQCPFCMTIFSKDATVCPSCKAQKGYTQASGVVYNKMRTIIMGVIVPGLIALFAFSFGTTFGYLVGIFLMIPVVLSIRRLMAGPMWFQTRSVN